ncbi:unnamed protein product [Diamesa serratosioi]
MPIKKEAKLKDWNNYEFMLKEKSRVGPGEQGKGLELTDPEEIELNKILYEKTGFSVVVSDKISVERSLLDAVHPHCMDIKYLEDLPTVSVIIIFHNEVKSVLLRTIHSVINRTPPELLHEVIIVNDKSTEPELYEPLETYVHEHFGGLVNIINLTERKGLIVTRMEGARAATGDVLVFFDSHVEVQNNWLPPLLEPIALNRRIGTLPIVDYFDSDTFAYNEIALNFFGSRGVIDWFLDFHELSKLPKDIEVPLKPFPNPIMLGCAFAIDRKFFFELGGYDEELKIWNGENYELSFKLWLCADGLFTVPCSRVVHSFRNINPSRKRSEDYVARNFKRISEVWLDEYKTLPYQLEPERYANVDAGDLTKVLEVKKRLECKPFRHFLKYIAPDMTDKYPPVVELPKFASGSIRSLANPRLCLDSNEDNNEQVHLNECPENLDDPPYTQHFELNFFKSIAQKNVRYEYCLDTYYFKMVSCNDAPYGNQFWTFNKDTKVLTNEGKCLTNHLNNDTISLTACQVNDMTQQWEWSYINSTAMEHFDELYGYNSIML